MRFLTEKAIEEIRKRSVANRKHIAWVSASFGRNVMFYQNTQRHPDDYIEGADKRYAEMVIRDFKELLNTDRDAAKFIYETYFHDLWSMVRDTLNEDPGEYFRFYYKRQAG